MGPLDHQHWSDVSCKSFCQFVAYIKTKLSECFASDVKILPRFLNFSALITGFNGKFM